MIDRVLLDTNGCWLWQGARDTQGYGNVALGNGRWDKAHRLAYQMFCGSIPKGLEIDHLCRVKRCVNPMHLEPVMHVENQRRMMAVAIAESDTKKYGRKPMHCIRGHEFTEANTRERNGKRRCRACDVLRARAYRRAA